MVCRDSHPKPLGKAPTQGMSVALKFLIANFVHVHLIDGVGPHKGPAQVTASHAISLPSTGIDHVMHVTRGLKDLLELINTNELEEGVVGEPVRNTAAVRGPH